MYYKYNNIYEKRKKFQQKQIQIFSVKSTFNKATWGD